MVNLTASHAPSSRYYWPWVIGAVLIAALVLLPVIIVIWLALFPVENIWPHLQSSVLSYYLGNTLFMMIWVWVIALIIGVPTAWLIVTCDFPLRSLLEWALLLPLAIPAYIAAYAFVDFWEYAGPFSSFLQWAFSLPPEQLYRFFPVRWRAAAVLVLGFSLYPYIYMLARIAFREQSLNMIETAQTLGLGFWACFFRIRLPLARPALVVGSALVMMETLGDFGAMEYFAVQTLTTGIFAVWLEGSNIGGAAQLACIILGFLSILLFAERYSRGCMRVSNDSKMTNSNIMQRQLLSGWSGAVSFLFCASAIFIGFVMPFLIIVHRALGSLVVWQDSGLLHSLWTSVWISLCASLLIVIFGLLFAYSVRLLGNIAVSYLLSLTFIGYAAPGAILGLGLLLPLSWLEGVVADFINLFGIDVGLFITGSGFAIIICYVIRFFALSVGGLDSGFGRIPEGMSLAAFSLGYSPFNVLRFVHFRLLRASFLSVFILVFIDCVKELPATLLLRPFGFETLSTYVYGFAVLEDIKGGAVGSLLIIAVGLISVIFLGRSLRNI